MGAAAPIVLSADVSPRVCTLSWDLGSVSSYSPDGRMVVEYYVLVRVAADDLYQLSFVLGLVGVNDYW